VKYGDGGVHIDAKNVSYGSMTLLNQQPNLRIEPRAAVRINDESNKILPAGKYIVGMVGYARYGQKRQIQPRVWLLKPASITPRPIRPERVSIRPERSDKVRIAPIESNCCCTVPAQHRSLAPWPY
jgi:hypothetical protein